MIYHILARFSEKSPEKLYFLPLIRLMSVSRTTEPKRAIKKPPKEKVRKLPMLMREAIQTPRSVPTKPTTMLAKMPMRLSFLVIRLAIQPVKPPKTIHKIIKTIPP